MSMLLIVRPRPPHLEIYLSPQITGYSILSLGIGIYDALSKQSVLQTC